MKKILAAALALALCLAALAAPALAEAADVTGDWYLTEMTAQGMTINPGDMGMYMAMNLAEDGTATVANNFSGADDTQTGTWTMEGDTISVTIQDDVEEFVLADGKLTAGQEGMSMLLSREMPATVPQAVAAESEEPFLGAWKLDSVLLNGMLIPAENYGVATHFVIEPGKVTETSGEGEEAKVTEYTSEFGNGVLQLKAEDEDVKLPVLFLNTNGGIMFILDVEEGVSMTMYFVGEE